MHATEWGGGQLTVVRPPSGGFPRHSHDEYVISVNLCGLERVRLDRASFDVNLDEFTVYNPGQVQSCTTQVPPDATFASVSWYVPPAVVESLTDDTPVDFERPVVRSPHLRDEFLAAARAFRELAPEGHPPPAESAVLIQERLVLVLSQLLDLAAGRRVPAPEPADARIARLLARLRSDLSGAPRLAELADEAGMSREHLIRTFTRATGTPPYAWHLAARLAEARDGCARASPSPMSRTCSASPTRRTSTATSPRPTPSHRAGTAGCLSLFFDFIRRRQGGPARRAEREWSNRDALICEAAA